MSKPYFLIVATALASPFVMALPSVADFPGEVEAARANARAGGPTNERSAELLSRYGRLSGTPKREWQTGRVSDRDEAASASTTRKRAPARH